jgi:hypothetical protein
MDAQELFMQLAPYLKEQTQKFVEDFWKISSEGASRKQASEMRYFQSGHVSSVVAPEQPEGVSSLLDAWLWCPGG